ncbi:unnamed protein product [Urochloa humidicola]
MLYLSLCFVLQILEFDGPAHDLDYVMVCDEGTQAQRHEATWQRGGVVQTCGGDSAARRRGVLDIYVKANGRERSCS